MKKICLILAALSILTFPLLVSADSYDGPYCSEPTSTTNAGYPDPSGIRGTCKTITIKNIVGLDPALVKNYFIGTHNPIGYNCDRGCGNFTQYSERLTIFSSSTVITSPDQPDEAPIEVAVFDKSFFLPLLTSQFKKSQLNFSANNFPPINIDIYQQKEFNAIKDQGPKFYPFPRNTQMDVLQKSGSGDYIYYIMSTFLNQEYGKYIWAPVGKLAESQYADLYENDQALTSKTLSISYEYYKYGASPVVPIIDPLNSITNYWTYTQKNGKIALAWQKTNYALDDGSIKTVTPDNNDAAIAVTNYTPVATSTLATSTLVSSSQAEPAPTTVTKNIFQRIWDFILSWFR